MASIPLLVAVLIPCRVLLAFRPFYNEKLAHTILGFNPLQGFISVSTVLCLSL